ncbi:type II toxin-antitoxin system YafQ family toxin [Bartonella henselae]|nr:type II toxin-antitoxin system YafQ family toxin [Bartonella henselae]
MQGNWKPRCDLHREPDWLLIEPDWLLIDSVNDEYVHCDRTGTHSNMFK